MNHVFDSYNAPLYPSGYLELAIGPMFSGKTSWILEVYKQYKFCDKLVSVINYSKDKRYSENMLSTHDKQMIPCIMLDEFMGTEMQEYPDLLKSQVVLINEGQFFKRLVPFVKDLIDMGKIVYVCGLDGDFKREKFGGILDLIPICDKVTKLTALCGICKSGARAIFSHRTSDGEEQEQIGNDNYIPVCRRCYDFVNSDLEL
tara:strand:+ start:10978 stop:11583 length:606 start_codon:yes stop_codon:yes gene_type:complete